MMTSGAFSRMASAAASAALSPVVWFWANIMKFPPATASCAPNPSSTVNSPSITGIFQHRLPLIMAFFWKPSPKYLRLLPTASFLFAVSKPL